MSTTTKVLSAQGAATVLPANSAVLTVDGANLLTPVTIAAIAAAVAQKLGIPAGATVMKKVIIPSVDTDFNDLTDDMTVYSFVSDVPKTVTLTNSPKEHPSGGFSVCCIREGVYRRQIASFYQDSSTYIRSQIYGASATVWTDWSKTQTAQMGGKHLPLRKLQTFCRQERRAAA